MKLSYKVGADYGLGIWQGLCLFRDWEGTSDENERFVIQAGRENESALVSAWVSLLAEFGSIRARRPMPRQRVMRLLATRLRREIANIAKVHEVSAESEPAGVIPF